MRNKDLITLVKRFLYAFLISTTVLFNSCQEDNVSIANLANNHEIEAKNDSKIVAGDITVENIKDFSASELLQMKAYLKAAGIDVSGIVIEEKPSERGIINDLLLRAIKVTTKSPHPADSTRTIDLSGVLLVPKIALTSLRLVVAPVPTFTTNEKAPSNLFQNNIALLPDGMLNYLYFWSLQAYEGFAVLLPDYPGFGDSYQQCFIPYVVQKPMVRAAIDITKAAQQVMLSEGYRYKNELVITGYSQGAFVATSLARELETNPSHNLSLNLLVSGGTPADLMHIANGVRSADDLPTPYLMPYAICGFKSNGYPDIIISDILTEPSASDAYMYFDGTHSDISDAFPSQVSELFTQDFIDNLETSPKLVTIKRALQENSIQPWPNQCKIVMIHGEQDDTVYTENAQNFANRQNEIGGNVTFRTVLGNHTTSVIQYYLSASTNLLIYK